MEYFYNNGVRTYLISTIYDFIFKKCTYILVFIMFLSYILLECIHIGDNGYPLEPWIMTPLPHYPQWSRQYHYNEKLCKARNVVERFFGVFKGTWRCLSYQRVLMYAPEIAEQIINTCAVLHNMRLHLSTTNRHKRK